MSVSSTGLYLRDVPSEHDPLCPFARIDYWLNEPPIYCICRWIPDVREDERLRLLSIVDDTIVHRDNCNLFVTMDGDCDCGKNDLLDRLTGKS